MNACVICGRTILAGERVHGYVGEGEERSVCELCVARADRLGWRPAGEEEPEPVGNDGHGGRRRFRDLLQRRPRRPGTPAGAPLANGRAEESESPEQIPAPSPDPAASPRRARPASALDTEAPTPFERALARFNSSEAGRTVAGLTRTLGTPWASIGASAGAPDEVRITVAWELSWYQWGVDIGDELRAVFQLDKGREVDQLDPAAKQWNATVGEDGKLRLSPETAAR